MKVLPNLIGSVADGGGTYDRGGGSDGNTCYHATTHDAPDRG